MPNDAFVLPNNNSRSIPSLSVKI